MLYYNKGNENNVSKYKDFIFHSNFFRTRKTSSVVLFTNPKIHIDFMDYNPKFYNKFTD